MFKEKNDYIGPRSQTPCKTAIPVSPALSFDERRLYSTTVSGETYAVNTENGKVLWNVMGQQPIVAEPKVSPDDQRLYLIRSIDGRVSSVKGVTGEPAWLVSCEFYEEDCANSVMANFDLSRSGHRLYYADVIGRVIALELEIGRAHV